ncbi:MAG: rRNA maturation RNase YbeY [Candidatus Binatus sp.]|uniref:rRNA maturation RNase YbeY n=1 Tax=Candidatus Binatus sp. TaxID=2811406 RepID=UPI002720F6BB|nr:rRNA maturation RNase YbeY [Candidatus Binatus sp.]MDO8434644.1 rRNA maturation RNase YbeY [Candidatus Binatus sp.]
MAVEFRSATARARGYARALRTDAELLMRAAGVPDCELSVMLVSDRAIRALNRNYRHLDLPADVLSFSQLEEVDVPPPDPRALINRRGLPLGDVVISIDTAARQARELSIDIPSRLRALLIHGFLHLIGYDHERSPAEARRMFARARALESRIAPPKEISRPRTKTRARKAASGRVIAR